MTQKNTRRSVSIDEMMFLDAFGRDVDFQDMSPQSAYLDLETGNVIWIFEEDEDAEFYAGIKSAENRGVRERIAASPENYLEVPGRDHSEHHKILQEFLSSGWTEDRDLIRSAREAYSGSIGRWKEGKRKAGRSCRTCTKQLDHSSYALSARTFPSYYSSHG